MSSTNQNFKQQNKQNNLTHSDTINIIFIGIF